MISSSYSNLLKHQFAASTFFTNQIRPVSCHLSPMIYTFHSSLLCFTPILIIPNTSSCPSTTSLNHHTHLRFIQHHTLSVNPDYRRPCSLLDLSFKYIINLSRHRSNNLISATQQHLSICPVTHYLHYPITIVTSYRRMTSMDLRVGGKYRIGKKIGSGSFG